MWIRLGETWISREKFVQSETIFDELSSLFVCHFPSRIFYSFPIKFVPTTIEQETRIMCVFSGAKKNCVVYVRALCTAHVCCDGWKARRKVLVKEKTAFLFSIFFVNDEGEFGKCCCWMLMMYVFRRYIFFYLDLWVFFTHRPCMPSALYRIHRW